MKKKIRTAVAGIVAATVIFACSVTCFADAKVYIIGDCNNDGAVNISDVVTLKRYLNSKNKEYNDRMDINGDWRVDNTDYNLLLNMVLGG